MPTVTIILKNSTSYELQYGKYLPALYATAVGPNCNLVAQNEQYLKITDGYFKQQQKTHI